MKYANVFTPGKIGTMELKNRLIVPAMETEYSADGTINDRITDYWIERAKGGWALLTMEVAAVSRNGKGFPNSLTLYDDDCIPMYKKLIDEVHKYGSKMSIQLHHAGRQTISYFIGGEQIVAPSAIAHPMYGEVPRELTTEECYQIIEDYGDAAVRAQKAGFDAVEVHAGHGYLPVQFMSENINRRIDEFGGDLVGRTKFLVDVIKNIKAKCGADYPVIVRISGEEHLDDGITLEETKMIAPLLEEAGVDAINVSNGAALSQEYIAGCMALKFGYNLVNAEAVKSVVNIPIIGVGKLSEPYLLEHALTSNKADFLAIGRGSIADPHFPEKMAADLFDEITPCISCCQKCLPIPGQPSEIGMSCLANPFAGREKEMVVKPAEVKKNIMVVGGGPAGMVFAYIAAQRGHSVTVYEKSATLGGQFALAAIPPTKQPIAKLLKHYLAMGKKFGVKYVCGQEVTLDLIKEKNPDSVVLATGSIPLILNIEGIHNDNVVTALDILAGRAVAGNRVLVLGGGLVGAETADFLAQNLRSVAIVEMMGAIAADETHNPKVFLMQRLNSHNVQMHVGTKVVKILQDGVICEKDGQEIQLTGFDTIVLAFGVRSYNPLEEPVKNAGYDTYVIGDAVKGRNAVDAILEGAKAGIII